MSTKDERPMQTSASLHPIGLHFARFLSQSRRFRRAKKPVPVLPRPVVPPVLFSSCR